MLGLRKQWSRQKRLLLELAVLLVVGYIAFIGWAEQQVAWLVHEVAGDTLTIGQVRVGFPPRLILSDVRVAHTPPEAVAKAARVIIVPRWYSRRAKTVWIARVEFDKPHLSFHRTNDGALFHPLGVIVAAATSTTATPADGALQVPTWTAGWRLVINTVQVTGGKIELIDERPAAPFRGALAQLLIDGGPLTIPLKAAPASVTMQGRLLGEQAHSAPAYCSGWVDVEGRNMELSCRLDPFPLAAFGPYYPDALQKRALDASVQATSQLTAKANAFEGRVSLKIDNLSGADLSLFGRTLADLKKIPEGPERTLSGEIQMVGPFDQPSAWKIQLVPGDEIVQRLVNPLLDRGIEIIRIRLGTQTIPVGITAATHDAMSNMEAASQQVQDSLQVIAPAEPAPVVSPPAASSSETSEVIGSSLSPPAPAQSSSTAPSSSTP